MGQLGRSYGELGNHQQAVEAGQKAVELDPSSAVGWNNLGECYAYLGEHERATEAYRKALSLTDDPDITSEVEESLKQLGADK